VEIGAHPAPEVAAFYHDRERAAQLLAVAAWRKGNAGQSRPAQPFLQIPPLFDGTVPLPQSSDVTLQIDAEGKVTDVLLPPSFPAAAADTLDTTLRAWLFLPALKQGAPVPSRVRLPLNF
jgi:hypothetical protein